MKKVFVYGAYDLDNLGDDYMMYQINKKLQSKELSPVYLNLNQKENYFNMNDINRKINPVLNEKNIIKKFIKIFIWFFDRKNVLDIDAIIFMGGGYTNENFKIRNLLKIYYYVLKFKINHKKIYFTGQTVGPYKSIIGKFLIKKIYKSANKVFVREIYSKELLNKLKIKSELIGDDAFLTVENVNINSNKEFIIFNYKDFKGYEQYKNLYFDFLLNIAKKSNLEIKVIPFRSSIESNEYKINYKLYKFLKEHNINVEFCVERNIDKFNEIFNKSKIIVGTAYHSIVLGLIFKNDVYSTYLGEYYKMKINGILNWYDYNDKCFDLKQIKANKKVVENILDSNFDIDKQVERTNLIANNVIKAWDEIIEEIKLKEY